MTDLNSTTSSARLRDSLRKIVAEERRPVPASIIRPPFSFSSAFVQLIGYTVVVFLFAWFVMLLLPVVWTHATWGYWRVYAMLLLVRLVFGFAAPFPLDMWSTERKRG